MPAANELELSTSSEAADKEAVLVASVSQGDEAAFEELYTAYYRRLHRFMFRVIGGDCSPPELINDVMHVVWRKARTFDGSCLVSTWIFGIALRIARKSMSRQAANAIRCAGQPSLEDDRFSDWERQLEREDWLEKGLACLSPEQRAVVELTYFQGLHYREIATILGCPENTVKTRMFHSRARLRKELLRYKSAT